MGTMFDDMMDKELAAQEEFNRTHCVKTGTFEWALLQMKAGKWVTLPSWAHNRRVTIRDGIFYEAWMNFGRALKEEPLFDQFPLAELQSTDWTLYRGRGQ